MEGKVYALSRASTDRWVRRQVAEEVEAPGYVVPAQPKSDDEERPGVAEGVEGRPEDQVDNPEDVGKQDSGGDGVGTVANRRPGGQRKTLWPSTNRRK